MKGFMNKDEAIRELREALAIANEDRKTLANLFDDSRMTMSAAVLRQNAEQDRNLLERTSAV